MIRGMALNVQNYRVKNLSDQQTMRYLCFKKYPLRF